MDMRKLPEGRQREIELGEAVRALGTAMQDAEESVLDLEEAMSALRIARDPERAAALQAATVACLRAAMRR